MADPACGPGACEVSATLTMGFKNAAVWPIFVQQNGTDIGIDLDGGDALIYRGMDLPIGASRWILDSNVSCTSTLSMWKEH